MDNASNCKRDNSSNYSFYSLVLAGGSGTRFWPLSTKKKPKQYIPLFSENSLLKETLLRFENLIPNSRRYVVTIKSQIKEAKKSCDGYMADDGYILEPCARNTAPCIFLSLLELLKKGISEDDVVAIVPSDHMILNVDGFRKTLEQAARFAYQHRNIVTLGIRPNFPHTGYGYILRSSSQVNGVFDVREFKEKPELEQAKQYVSSGKYFWNAGMFVARIGILLDEFSKHSKEIYAYRTLIENNLDNEKELLKQYERLEAISIDYAVMEKSNLISVIPAEFDWNDLGSWDALEKVFEPIQDNFITSCNEKFYFENSSGNVIRAPKDQLVSLVGIKDLIIINEKDSLVIVSKNESQKIKNIVSHLEKSSWGQELI